jgi:hypothetical protein
MIGREALAHEFVKVVKKYYPKAGEILNHCFVKILECHIEKLGKHLYYIGIYYPEEIAKSLNTQEDAFSEVAENMGLIEVVYINANRLIRDPISRLKEENPRLWLELYWVATHNTNSV